MGRFGTETSLQNVLLIEISTVYKSWKFVKLHCWDTLKKAGTGTSIRLLFNSKDLDSRV